MDKNINKIDLLKQSFLRWIVFIFILFICIITILSETK
jgi:hypothetical protein